MKKLPLFIALVGAHICVTTSVASDRLEEVFVTASGIETARRQIGTSVSVIEKGEIELRGYQSFTDLMSTQMSITATGSGGLGKAANLRIRGEEGYRTLILIDGVEISDPTGTQVGPQVQHLLNSGDIERVEVLRGPQGFLYGADAGGVINILTRGAGEGSGGGLLAEYGSYDSRKLNAYLTTGSASGDLFVSVTELDTQGFNARTAFPESEDDGYNNLTSHMKLGWNLDADAQPTRVQLVLRKVNAETEFDNCGSFLSPSDNCLGNFDQSIAKFNVDFSGEHSNHVMSFSRSDIKRQNWADAESSYDTSGSVETLSYLGDLSLGETTTLVMGLDGKKQTVEVDSGADLQRDQLGIFSEVQLSFGDLSVNMGARHDDNEDFGEHLSARMSAAYIYALNSRSQVKIRGSYGSGFRAPSLFEIDYNRVYNRDKDPSQEGLTALKEEQSQGFDLGVEYHHQNGAFVEIGYFDQKITDEISFDLLEYRGYLQRRGDSESSGVEMAFSYPLSANLKLRGNYTDNDTEDADGLQRARRPEVSFNLGLQGLFVGGDLSLLINYREAKKRVDYVNNGVKSDLDDYKLLDISASYAFSERVKCFARAENSLDEKYTDLEGFNTAGATVYAGFQYQL